VIALASGISPWDVVEFAILWWLVYRGLLIVRGTRTVPMAVGLLMIFVIYQITRWLELITLYTVLHTFLSSIVILAVIVFQDDIRRALVRVGRFARFNNAQEAQVIDEVIRGATSLADRRIGALIVFEREARLDDFFIEPGTEMDAAVAGELLFAVFIPDYQNPIHDGAVILRNFRIHRAGAFLPLTRNTNLEKSLGTRHRAAIGITEETDALALVVSEERGTISLCQEGFILKDLDPPELRKALLTQFTRPRSPLHGKVEASASPEPATGPAEERRDSQSQEDRESGAAHKATTTQTRDSALPGKDPTHPKTELLRGES
jgi:diadenylate cyclase